MVSGVFISFGCTPESEVAGSGSEGIPFLGHQHYLWPRAESSLALGTAIAVWTLPAVPLPRLVF